MACLTEAEDGLLGCGPRQRPAPAPSPRLRVCFHDYPRAHMALRNFAEAARRGYASDIRLFPRHITDNDRVAIAREIERGHLHHYFAELDRRGQAGATRARKLAAVKSFFGYLEDSGVIGRDPAESISRPRQEVSEPRVLASVDASHQNVTVDRTQ